MDEKIFVRLWYDINKDTFQVESNTKDPKEMVHNFLRTQLGIGEDNSELSRQSVYQLTLSWDPSKGTFTCEHDCGNSGLRDVLLIHFVTPKLRDLERTYNEQTKTCRDTRLMTNLYVIKKDGKYYTRYDKSILHNPDIWEDNICDAAIFDDKEIASIMAKEFDSEVVWVEVREIENAAMSPGGTITEPGASDLSNEGC